VEAVEYKYRFPYPLDPQGDPSPILQLRVFNPSNTFSGLDIDTHLDSGAEYSLLNGWIARTLGFDLLSGNLRTYGPLVGPTIAGRVHRVRLSHPELGNFDMEMGFSTVEIHREILGRDFFNLTQIGFRERQLTYYLSTVP